MFKSILVSIFSLLLVPAFAEDADVAAVIEGIDGAPSIEIEHAGVWSPAPIGTTVEPGDSLRTGAASARLVYGDGSAIALSTATEIELEPDPTRVIELKAGTVWGKIEKSAAPAALATPTSAGSPYKFTLRSRAVVMGVRGTEFLVESAAGGEIAVNTLEGTVDTAPDLVSLHSGKGVPVHALERIRSRPGAPFGKAEAFKGEELKARLAKDHGGLVRFLGRPVRKLRPNRANRREERLRHKAEIRANPGGQPGQGKFGTPGRRHR